MRTPLVITPLDGVPTVAEGDDLADVILAALKCTAISLADGDLIAIAQKIVSKAEGRRRLLAQVEPSSRARELAAIADKDPRVVELILRESSEVLRSRPGVIVVAHRLGFVAANAGIDASNVEIDDTDEAVLLLPENPDDTAGAIHEEIHHRTGKRVGVVINDSFGRAWRMGTVGTAIGVAGLTALLDLRGKPDRTGRPLRSTEVGIADEIAAAASLMMGQSNEGLPIVHLRGVPGRPGNGCAADLVRPKHLDLFR